MRIKADKLEFDWDEGNRNKIYDRHGITVGEAESVFADKNLIVLSDVTHSQDETRLIAIGENLEGKSLHIVFTMRSGKIRIISARKMHRKEVVKYKKIKKDS